MIHHDWLRTLRSYGEGALLGILSIDPSIRPPRANGETDAEVLLELDAVEPGPRLDMQLATAARRIKVALAKLSEVKAYGVEHGPSQWREYYEPLDSRPLVERLFLEGFEFNRNLDLTVTFDFEDLDVLLVHLDPTGHGRAVNLRS